MHNTEEKVNNNRRKMIITITMVVGIIVFISMIIALIKATNYKKKEEQKLLTCQLGITNGAKKDEDGVYREEVEIAFENIDIASEDYHLIKRKVGLSDISTNDDSYRITRTGTYLVNGYIQDSNNNIGTCSMKVQVELSTPTCELVAVSKEVGEHDWYKSDVEVNFKDMASNNPNTIITKYFIEKSGVNADIVNKENNASYLVTNDEEVHLIGYVIDDAGNIGSCEIKVKKDSSKPTCTLKVTSGTVNSNNIYTDSPTIEFDTDMDSFSGLKAKGIEIEKNYENDSYTLKSNGTYTIY